MHLPISSGGLAFIVSAAVLCWSAPVMAQHTLPGPRADANTQRQRLETEQAVQTTRRAELAAARPDRVGVTLAPEISSAGTTDPTFTVKQNPDHPLAPPAPVFDGINLVDAMLYGLYAVPALNDYVEHHNGETIELQKAVEALTQVFQGTLDSQDDPITAAIKFMGGGLPSPNRLVSTSTTGNVMFIAAMAPSIFGGHDVALLVGAAEVQADPTTMVWHTFRIPLIKAATSTHFCTPSTTASVLTNFRVGVSPLGRLFIVFDSFENSKTTGSIIDFDVASLLADASPEMKCFTGQIYANLAPPDVGDSNTKAYFLGIKDLATVKRFALTIGAMVSDDRLRATADINIPTFDFNPAAVQPNGFHLYDGSFEFRTASIQRGKYLWNVQVVGDGNGHPKVRLYKFSNAGTDPVMTLTLSTRSDHLDDLIAPSFDISGTKAYVTLTRTVAGAATGGNATLMLAHGPNSSTTGWKSKVIAKSVGQFTKNTFGQPCDPFEFAGCLYGPNSGTFADALTGRVWSVGELITTGTLGTGGAGNEVNWNVKGVSVVP